MRRTPCAAMPGQMPPWRLLLILKVVGNRRSRQVACETSALPWLELNSISAIRVTMSGDWADWDLEALS